jgi:hypothetical protein
VKDAEEYKKALLEWQTKVDNAYRVLSYTIIDRLQSPLRQSVSPADAWTRLQDLYAPSGLQRRFALSRQLYSMRKLPTTSMQEHEVAYDAIIEDLARAGKILDTEELAITYLNTLPEQYSSLIQSMEPHIATLTSQMIKAKVREEEQRQKNVAGGNGVTQSNDTQAIKAHNGAILVNVFHEEEQEEGQMSLLQEKGSLVQ